METFTEQEITDYINGWLKTHNEPQSRACAISSLRDLVIENINLKFELAEFKQEVADLKGVARLLRHLCK
jgi:hypothetical protein